MDLCTCQCSDFLIFVFSGTKIIIKGAGMTVELKDFVKQLRGGGWFLNLYLTANGKYVGIAVVGEERSITEEFDTVDDAAGAGFQIILEDLGV